MIYNERVTLIFEEKPEDELLESTETKKFSGPLYAKFIV